MSADKSDTLHEQHKLEMNRRANTHGENSHAEFRRRRDYDDKLELERGLGCTRDMCRAKRTAPTTRC